MKKTLVFIGIICLWSSFLIGQTRLPGAPTKTPEKEVSFDFNEEKQLKKDIDDVGLEVANKLMRCCSSLGGTEINTLIQYDSVRMNQLTNAFTIPMTVNWKGSISNAKYWIKGKLIVKGDGSKAWLKIKDSGGFPPGCSNNCIK